MSRRKINYNGRVGAHYARTARTVVGSSPEPSPMLVDTSASMWIEKAQLPCWPLSMSSGDICSGFQNQDGTLVCFLVCVILRFTSDVTPAECQNRGINGPMNRTYILHKIKKPQSMCILNMIIVHEVLYYIQLLPGTNLRQNIVYSQHKDQQVKSAWGCSRFLHHLDLGLIQIPVPSGSGANPDSCTIWGCSRFLYHLGLFQIPVPSVDNPDSCTIWGCSRFLYHLGLFQIPVPSGAVPDSCIIWLCSRSMHYLEFIIHFTWIWYIVSSNTMEPVLWSHFKMRRKMAQMTRGIVTEVWQRNAFWIDHQWQMTTILLFVWNKVQYSLTIMVKWRYFWTVPFRIIPYNPHCLCDCGGGGGGGTRTLAHTGTTTHTHTVLS